MNKEQALELGSESKAEKDGGGLVLVTKKERDQENMISAKLKDCMD